jgi:predicted RNase H-like HicB family nuclease
MMKHYHVLLEWDPDASSWVTYVPALNHLSTFGETQEEALANTREAILGYLERRPFSCRQETSGA